MARTLSWVSVVLVLAGCLKGGGLTDLDRSPPRPDDIALPEGYRIELVADRLDFPVGVAFDEASVPYVVEAGYSSGERFTTPRIIRLDPSGDRRVIFEGTNPQWNGIDYHQGRFYVAEASQTTPDRIWEIDKSGTSARAIVGDLPSTWPSEFPSPIALPAVHSSSNGSDIGRSKTFGHVGEAFVAQFGDLAPAVGSVVQPVGFKVVRVDPASGVVHDFAVNNAKVNGPASYLNSGGLERPVAARFSPDGNALYIVDFGVLSVTADGLVPRQGTGRVWKVVHE